MIHFHIQNEGTVLLLRPLTESAREWVAENISEHQEFGERFANHRLVTGGRTAEGCDSSQVTDLPLVGQPIG